MASKAGKCKRHMPTSRSKAAPLRPKSGPTATGRRRKRFPPPRPRPSLRRLRRQGDGSWKRSINLARCDCNDPRSCVIKDLRSRASISPGINNSNPILDCMECTK
uniref:Uncharacterized protein n=1 Tax=Oryza meridionalis TaxID=40149 RepID=A0A0E0C8S8_9ORYZ